jgi:hypothetical protein
MVFSSYLLFFYGGCFFILGDGILKSQLSQSFFESIMSKNTHFPPRNKKKLALMKNDMLF